MDREVFQTNVPAPFALDGHGRVFYTGVDELRVRMINLMNTENADTDCASTQEVVRRIQNGERQLFQVLYERYYHRLRFLARCRLPRPLRAKLDSDDLVQSAFRHAVERIDQFRNYRSDGLFLNWLSQVLLNDLKNKIDHYHCGKADVGREKPLAPGNDASAAGVDRPGPPAEGPGVVTLAQMHEDLGRLESVMHELPDRSREVLLLRWFCGMTWEEIGEKVGCSLSGAKQRELAAQAQLIARWHRRYGAGPGAA